jgi:hypothetical protein
VQAAAGGVHVAAHGCDGRRRRALFDRGQYRRVFGDGGLGLSRLAAVISLLVSVAVVRVRERA